MLGPQVCVPCKRYFELVPQYDTLGLVSTYFEWQCPVCSSMATSHFASTIPEELLREVVANSVDENGNQLTPEMRDRQLRALLAQQLTESIAAVEEQLLVLRRQLADTVGRSPLPNGTSVLYRVDGSTREGIITEIIVMLPTMAYKYSVCGADGWRHEVMDADIILAIHPVSTPGKTV